MDGHMNERIDLFGPGDGCLVHRGQSASGLPMADHDHGPSGFGGDNDGTITSPAEVLQTAASLGLCLLTCTKPPSLPPY